jgi:hypothetical protein
LANILVPEFAILSRATEVVALNSLAKQHGHIDNIKVWKKVASPTSHTHGQGKKQVTNIIKMSRKKKKENEHQLIMDGQELLKDELITLKYPSTQKSKEDLNELDHYW